MPSRGLVEQPGLALVFQSEALAIDGHGRNAKLIFRVNTVPTPLSSGHILDGQDRSEQPRLLDDFDNAAFHRIEITGVQARHGPLLPESLSTCLAVSARPR